ncbi:MAG TPA: hypothetical protein VHC63_06710 [Acidimicrobiales bacterium]|nr:hypothetical protein [Acidimicrobiales bacterium]
MATRQWTRVHLATLALAFVALAVVCRGKWFFGDEWDFILYRGLHHPRWGLLYPHNEHWSTLPILWYRAVFSVFGLRSYWPYLAGVFGLHLLACHLLWRLMRRAGVGIAVATGLVTVFAFFGAGSENMTWAFQVGFVGSLVSGMALLLALDGAPTRRRVALVSAGAVASLLLSGISVVMVMALALGAFGRWGARAAAVVAAPAAAVYVVWLRTAGAVGLSGDTKSLHGGPDDIPHYVWGGMSATLGAPFHSDTVGKVLLVALVVVAAARGRSWWRRAPEVCALAVAAPVMFAVISQGRGNIGMAAASRYLYLCAALLLAFIAFAVQQFAGRSVLRVALVLAVSVGLAASGWLQLRDNARDDRTRDQTVRGQMLAALTVARSEPRVSNFVDFTYNHDITVAEMASLRDRGRLPRLSPNPRQLAQARLALQVAVSQSSRRPVGGVVAALGPDATSRRRGACDTVDLRGENAALTRTGATGVVSVRPGRSGSALIYVPYPGGFAGPRIVPLTAGSAVTIAFVVAGPLILQLPAGEHQVCGLRAGA